MTSLRPHPLEIPEIIALVAQGPSLRGPVNRTFHRTLTPLLWHVYDDSLVYDIDNDKSRDKYLTSLKKGSRHIRIPSNILFSHCHHFRIFHNTYRALIRSYFPLPLQYTCFSETCTHLRELTLSRWIKDRVACQLIVKNPALRLLSWESSRKLWPVMSQRNYDALSVLHKLETLHLGRFTIDLARLCEAVLRRNATSLKEVSFRDMADFDSEEVWGPISGRSHSGQEDQDNQGGDYQRDGGENAMTVSASPGILLSNLKTLRLDCAWDEETFSIESLNLDGFDDEGFGHSGDEDDRNSADKLHDDDDEDVPRRTVVTIDNTALPGLFRCCPALEILFWRPGENIDMNRVSRLLREYCPRPDTIRRMDGLSYFTDWRSSNRDECVLLIQGCTPPLSPLPTTCSLSTDDAAVSSGIERDVRRQGLKYFEMGFWLLDTDITSALLNHSFSLQEIKLYFRRDNKINYENAGHLLQYCRRLKRFSIQGAGSHLSSQQGLLLFQREWRCQGLESLQILEISDPSVSRLFANNQDEQEVQGQAQSEEQGQGHGLEQSQEQIEAFEDSRSLVSSKTSTTATSNSKYSAFVPAHWRAVLKPSIRRIVRSAGLSPPAGSYSNEHSSNA